MVANGSATIANTPPVRGRDDAWVHQTTRTKELPPTAVVGTHALEPRAHSSGGIREAVSWPRPSLAGMLRRPVFRQSYDRVPLGFIIVFNSCAELVAANRLGAGRRGEDAGASQGGARGVIGGCSRQCPAGNGTDWAAGRGSTTDPSGWGNPHRW